MPSYPRFTCSIACVLFLCATVTAIAEQRTDLGTLSLQVRPPDAEIFIDGERWVGSERVGVLTIELPPGVHRVELRSPGRPAFSTEITIRAGETTPLNVALQGGPARAPERAVPSGPPPSSSLTGTSVSEDGFVVAPAFRVSELNHRTATFVGAYGGYVFAAHLLVGAGGYWQIDSTNGVRLAYGGPVAEWRVFPDRTIGFNLHGLVGAGQLYVDHDYYRFGPADVRYDGRSDNRSDPRPGTRLALPYYYDDIFFVAEPEAQVVVRLGTSIRVLGGVGYRATSAHGLNGATGSVSVQFGR
jgi:hypothetical protein